MLLAFTCQLPLVELMDIGTVLASVPKLPGHLLTIHGVVGGTEVAVVGVAGPVFTLLGPVPFIGVDNVLGDDDDVQEDLFFLTHIYPLVLAQFLYSS